MILYRNIYRAKGHCLTFDGRKREGRGFMSRESDRQLGVFVAGMLLGAVIGAGAALLTAPEEGTRTRKRLGRAASRVRTRSGDRWGDMVEELRIRTDGAIEGARKRLEIRP